MQKPLDWKVAHLAYQLDIVRQAVYSRSKGYCEKCGKQLPESWALHHRKLKSRGGKDEVANLVALHHACHNFGTDSVHLNPTQASDKGLMVPSWQAPQECPLTLPDGSIVTLTDDGQYHYLERKSDGW
jgi:hypothetical protein